MATTRRVAVLVGSLRRNSLNRKLAQALVATAPAQLALEIVEIGQLPLTTRTTTSSRPRPRPSSKAR